MRRKSQKRSYNQIRRIPQIITLIRMWLYLIIHIRNPRKNVFYSNGNSQILSGYWIKGNWENWNSEINPIWGTNWKESTLQICSEKSLFRAMNKRNKMKRLKNREINPRKYLHCRISRVKIISNKKKRQNRK